MNHSNLFESLEPRRLFAGVTILATGRLGGQTGWMDAMASAITANLGGPSQVPEYDLQVTIGANGLVANATHVDGTATPATSSTGEIIVLVDYEGISANASYPSTYIGQVAADYMMQTPVDGVLWASLPIHEVGVSRGAAIMDGISQTLGQSGVWVDQETYLDPDPLSQMGDPATTVFDNVEFADNYWRNDGSASQVDDGNPVAGAYNLNVAWLDADSVGYSTPHLAPAGYYIGTIDPTATSDGDGPIYSNWYGTTSTMPARNATGWIYSALVGAARPLSGVWTASGGTGTRTAAGQVGTQWGNASDLGVTSGTTFYTGSSINVGFIHQDRGSADTITFYLDSDRNPYDGTFAATLGSVNFAQTNTAASATETLSTAGVAPGSYWLCAKITDAAGNTRYAYDAITAPLTVKSTNPVAAVSSTSAIAAAGKTAETFVVTYTGLAPINVSSLSSSNLLVSGPGLTSATATYVGVDSNAGSDTRSVTYSVAAPAGGWTIADDGAYTVSVQANQVDDTLGRYVAAGSIGSFNVNIPFMTGSLAAAAPSYNLTTLGTSDWADWGSGNNFSSFNDKATGNGQISNITELGSGNYGAWYDPSRAVSWSDGAPTAADAEDNGYIWANNAVGAGYSFTVPASTTTQTLYIYAGGFSSGSTLTGHLSDGSAPDDVITASGTGLYSNFYTITFKAASAGQTLTISYVKNGNVAGSSGSVDLIAAALSTAVVAPLADITPPTAAVASAPSIIAASTAAYTFTVTYTDNVAVNAATLGNNNLLVTGTGYSQTATLVSTGLTNSATVVATYSVPAPAAGWANASNGTYSIALQANKVADTSGNFAAAVSGLGTFTVNVPVPAPTTGLLTGSYTAAAASYNLTTLGTSDWADWGQGNSYGSFNHKATGGSQISNVTALGSGSYGSWYDPSRSVSWSDGSTLASDAGDNAYIWANNAIGAGYSFTVAASTTTQTLYVYLGGYSSAATLTAHLSDGSAADYVVSTSGTGLYTNLYAITFKAASAGQTLTISYVKSSNINGSSGSVDLIAAALA